MKYVIEVKGEITTDEDYILHIVDSPSDFVKVLDIYEADKNE